MELDDFGPQCDVRYKIDLERSKLWINATWMGKRQGLGIPLDDHLVYQISDTAHSLIKRLYKDNIGGVTNDSEAN